MQKCRLSARIDNLLKILKLESPNGCFILNQTTTDIESQIIVKTFLQNNISA